MFVCILYVYNIIQEVEVHSLSTVGVMMLGMLGKDVVVNTVVLPACVVSKIRDKFLSETLAGFHYPSLS